VKTNKKLVLTFLALMVILTSISAVSAADVVVNPGDDIQAAIDAPTTQSGDTIIVNDNNGAAATYNANIKINKTNITLKSNGTVTLSALDPNYSVISIIGYENGNYATVEGFKITGTNPERSGIYILEAQGVKILENYIKGNGIGISIKGDCDVLVQGNYITQNTEDGISIYQGYLNGAETSSVDSSPQNILLTPLINQIRILENTIINNGLNGISIHNTYLIGVAAVSTAPTEYIPTINIHINFNRIVDNAFYGLSYMTYLPVQGLLFTALDNNEPVYAVDATNNWWGTDNILDASTQINDTHEKVNWVPFLVMILSPNPVEITEGGTALIIADFTKNWNGEDTSALGHIPDGTPVYFTTNFGNLGSKFAWADTINGIAYVILRGDEGPGVASITASLDDATEYATVTIKAATRPSDGVAMQETGIPLIGLLVSLFLILGGGIAARSR